MKKAWKAIAAAFATLAMTIAGVLGVGTAFAADTTYTITVPSGDTHTYEVYQIFTGDFDQTSNILSNIKWGQNGIGTTEQAVSDEVLTALTGLSDKTDPVKLDTIKTYANLDSTAYGEVSNGNSLVNVPAGYYLFKDKDTITGNDTYSLYVTKVVGDVQINRKADVPHSEKKVKDINDTTDTGMTDWQDSADWDIGDKVPFELKATLGTDYDNYKNNTNKKYQLTFHDQESDGLTFDPNSVVVKVDGTTVNNGYYDVVTEGLEDGCTFEVKFDNLKDIASVKSGSVITVEYESTLNDHATIGSKGNPNKMHITFSNNPNSDQDEEGGSTPDDTVVVFTYKTVINKTDDENKPLEGAAFKLEKKLQDGSYTTVEEFDVTSGKTSFEFFGLDDGTYRLTETVTPSGYNTIDPIEFAITAEHDVLSDNPALTSLNGNKVTGEITFTSNESAGSLTADVVNKKGSNLPETGGMGTVALYVGGALVVLLAVFGLTMLVRRRNAR